jgi:hypothetical protein
MYSSNNYTYQNTQLPRATEFYQANTNAVHTSVKIRQPPGGYSQFSNPITGGSQSQPTHNRLHQITQPDEDPNRHLKQNAYLMELDRQVQEKKRKELELKNREIEEERKVNIHL